MALAAEAWPACHRQSSAYVALGWQIGVLAAALLTPALLPHIGWRGNVFSRYHPCFCGVVFTFTPARTGNFVQKQNSQTQTSLLTSFAN